MKTLETVEEALKNFTKIMIRKNYELYQYILSQKSDEQLHQEFCDIVGDELGEFNCFMRKYGRTWVEEYLLDVFSEGQPS